MNRICEGCGLVDPPAQAEILGEYHLVADGEAAAICGRVIADLPAEPAS